MAEKLAFGVFKSSVMELTDTMEVSLVAAASRESKKSTLTVRVDSFLAFYDAFLGKVEPLLKLLPKKGS